MRKWKARMTIAICLMLICAIFTGCTAAEPGVEAAPETKQTVYLPETYKFEGERATDAWSKEQVTIEKQFTYDDVGRCIQCVITEDSESRGHWVQTITFTYDERGNLTGTRQQSRSEKGGRAFESDTQYTIRYTYDQKGRVEKCEMEKVFSNSHGTNETSVKAYAFAYDKSGNLVTLTVGTEGECWYYYSYNKQGLLIAETSCILMQEDDPAAEEYKYRYWQRVFSRNKQGKVTSDCCRSAFSVERVDAARLDKLKFQDESAGYYTFYYDANGNLTYYDAKGYWPDVNELKEYKYDENGQWIPEEKHESIKHNGEMIDRLLAKYTQDEQGNIIKFENYQYTEEITYTTMELTKTQMEWTKRFFNHRSYFGDYCMVPDYVFGDFYPDWLLNGITYYHYFMGLFKSFPW